MKASILASYYHWSSTGEAPKHHDCPKGVLCFFNVWAAKEGPLKPHHEMHVHFDLEDEEKKLVFQVQHRKTYQKMNCVQSVGKAGLKNPNEAQHSKFRKSLFKTKFYNLKTMRYSVARMVLQPNFCYEVGSIFGIMPHYSSQLLKSRNRGEKESDKFKGPKTKNTQSVDSTYASG